MNARPPIAREKIIRLRASFIAQLPDRMANARRLHAALFNPATAATAAAAAAGLHRLLHGLKGTGSTLGLRALAEEAARGETIAIQIAEQSDLATAAAGGELLACLERLDQATRELIEAPAANAASAHEESSAPAFELAAAPAPAGARALEVRGPRLVYLCDDDAIQVEHMGAQLQCFGYLTTTFTDTGALAEAIRRRRPDAVVMDIIFPEGETAGTDTMMAMNGTASEPVPTVFMSARHDFDARLRSVQAGGGAFFPKPVDVMGLVARLDALTIRREPEPYRILIADDEPEVAAFHAHDRALYQAKREGRDRVVTITP